MKAVMAYFKALSLAISTEYEVGLLTITALRFLNLNEHFLNTSQAVVM
jgi:hypothetical protein